MIADESLVACAPRDRRGQQRTDGLGLKSDNGRVRISRMKRIPRICSVALTTPHRHEPGRSFFVHDLGKLLAPDPDRCAVTKNIVRARATRRRFR